MSREGMRVGRIQIQHFEGNYFHRPGPHLAYRPVLKTESKWTDVRGLFFATRNGTHWVTWERT